MPGLRGLVRPPSPVARGRQMDGMPRQVSQCYFVGGWKPSVAQDAVPGRGRRWQRPAPAHPVQVVQGPDQGPGWAFVWPCPTRQGTAARACAACCGIHFSSGHCSAALSGTSSQVSQATARSEVRRLVRGLKSPWAKRSGVLATVEAGHRVPRVGTAQASCGPLQPAQRLGDMGTMVTSSC